MRIMVLSGVLTLSIAGMVMAGYTPGTGDQLLGAYFLIQKSLASDSVNGIATSAAEIAKISNQAAAKEPEVKTQLIALSTVAAKFNAADLKAARNSFGDLSDRLIAYLKASHAKLNPPFQFFCSMAKKNWLQPDKSTRNPYYGSSMPTCGELVRADAPAQGQR